MVVDNGVLVPSADAAQAWWPPELGADPPDDLLLVLVSAKGTPAERWRVESWPRIGIDGRLRRGIVAADQPPDGPTEVQLSDVGAALARLAPAEAPSDRAVLAARGPRAADSDPSLASRRVANVSPEAWDAALAAEWMPYAWTYWTEWRGDPELIAHVGQAIRWAFRDAIGRDANVQTTIGVEPDDTERFDEPKAVVTDVTSYAARHMRTVRIESAADDISVLVRVNRGDDEAEEVLSKAVLLEVTSSAPEAFAIVRAIHARVRAALERGRPAGMLRSESMVGYLALDEAGKAVPGVTRRPADAAAGRNQGWLNFALLVAFVVFFALPIVGGLVSGAVMVLIATIVGAALGGLAAASVFAGGIMLGTSNRVLRLRTSVVGLAGGAVSAGVGTGVKQLADLL